MANMVFNAMRRSPHAMFSFGGFIRKYWYWLIFLIIIIPTIVATLTIARETDNPSYPFFVLAVEVFNADQSLERDVRLLTEGNIKDVVGIDKPQEGLTDKIKYNWRWFWTVPFSIISSLWLISFPFKVIYLFTRGRNTSEYFKNTKNAFIYFILYLFVINTAILVHGIVVGSTFVEVPDDDNYKGYYTVLKEMLPFHGVFSLVIYTIRVATGILPLPY